MPQAPGQPEFRYMTPRESASLFYRKCTALVRVLDFVAVLLANHNAWFKGPEGPGAALFEVRPFLFPFDFLGFVCVVICFPCLNRLKSHLGSFDKPKQYKMTAVLHSFKSKIPRYRS
jgi:hypothetical protein